MWEFFIRWGFFLFWQKNSFLWKHVQFSEKYFIFTEKSLVLSSFFLNLIDIHINNANFRDFYLPLVDESFLALRSNTNRGALVFPCEHCIIAERFVFLFGPSGKELLLSAILHEQWYKQILRKFWFNSSCLNGIRKMTLALLSQHTWIQKAVYSILFQSVKKRPKHRRADAMKFLKKLGLILKNL